MEKTHCGHPHLFGAWTTNEYSYDKDIKLKGFRKLFRSCRRCQYIETKEQRDKRIEVILDFRRDNNLREHICLTGY